jgi:hypothetical protein
MPDFLARLLRQSSSRPSSDTAEDRAAATGPAVARDPEPAATATPIEMSFSNAEIKELRDSGLLDNHTTG